LTGASICWKQLDDRGVGDTRHEYPVGARMEVGRCPRDGFGQTARRIAYFAQIGVDADVKEEVGAAGWSTCPRGWVSVSRRSFHRGVTADIAESRIRFRTQGVLRLDPANKKTRSDTGQNGFSTWS
jgi:hypothetical protein